MDRLGPWGGVRRVAVAVSGGADSLALALLAKDWGDPVALIVDHGLRPDSSAEAAGVRATLAARGIAATVLRLDELRPGPGIAARARADRYAALSAACRAAGLVDLLLGHHAGDQAETVLMRQRRGSGPDGLAGMAAAVATDDIRLLRPLLAIDPARLRAIVHAAGLTAVEDPTNTDLRTTRARLRREIGAGRAGLLAEAAAAGAARAMGEAASAAELAARAAIHPEGFAVISPGPIHPRSLAALLRSLSGRRFPVGKAAPLAAEPHAATLAGVCVRPAGRLGPGWLLVREAAALAPAVAARPGVVWDGRFRVAACAPGSVLGALGDAAAGMRHESGLPSAVLRALPALRHNTVLSDVPDLHYYNHCMPERAAVLRHAGLPAAGAPFLPA